MRQVNSYGHPLYFPGDGLPNRGCGARQAARGEFWYVLRFEDVDWSMVTWPWSCTFLVSITRRKPGPPRRLYLNPLPLGDMKMRRLAPSGQQLVQPALSSASKMFAKCPVVLEFITATAYEDGTARKPGYTTLRNKGHCFEITAYDYDSGMRLSVGGPDLDHVYLALNELLATPEAPWTVDEYLTSLLAKKRKK